MQIQNKNNYYEFVSFKTQNIKQSWNDPTTCLALRILSVVGLFFKNLGSFCWTNGEHFVLNVGVACENLRKSFFSKEAAPEKLEVVTQEIEPPVEKTQVKDELQEIEFLAEETQPKDASEETELSIIYYPGQRALPVGHAELEVEGKCYTIMSKVADKPHKLLSEQLVKAQKGRLPFKRCHISVTPEQLANVKRDLANRCSHSTCMHGVSRVLGQSADFHIPYIINLSPLASYVYLCGAKALGYEQRITKIESHGSATENIGNFLAVSIGVAVELSDITLGLNCFRIIICNFL